MHPTADIHDILPFPDPHASPINGRRVTARPTSIPRIASNTLGGLATWD